MYKYKEEQKKVGIVKMERNGYPWPASALGSEEMKILFNARKRTGKPITECLRIAVWKLEETNG